MSEDWLLHRFDDIRESDDHEFDVSTLRPQRTTTCAPTDARQEWSAALAKLEAQGMSRAAAIRQTAIRNPELHKAYLTSYNRAVR